jgi:hypothetical protein
MAFRDWAALIRDRIRAQLPGVVVRRKGNSIIFRYARRTATLTREDDTRWVTFGNESGSGTTMASLSVRRADAFTAGNVATTIADFFDAELSRPEKPS